MRTDFLDGIHQICAVSQIVALAAKPLNLDASLADSNWLLLSSSSLLSDSPGVLAGLASLRPSSFTIRSTCLWSGSISQPSSVHLITLFITRPSRTSVQLSGLPAAGAQAPPTTGMRRLPRFVNARPYDLGLNFKAGLQLVLKCLGCIAVTHTDEVITMD